MKGRVVFAAVLAAALIGSVFGADRGRSARSERPTEGFSYKGEWKESEIYKGDHQNKQGDTVQWGEFNGKPLYWWSKFWTQGEEPGTFGRQGGTNPWVLINSASYDPENGQNSVAPQWTGWNGDLENSLSAGEAAVPTWRDGAEGAYTIIHDDIGALTYEDHVKPAMEVNKKYPDIKVSWGTFVEESDGQDWEIMRELVRRGHEMTNHSMHHTSAADQWQWFQQGDTLPVDDPSIPAEVKGLVVKGFPMPEYSESQGNENVTVQNDLATLTYDEGWGGGVLDPDAYNSTAEISVDPAADVETVTLPTGQKQYVLYTDDGTADSTGARQGFILASMAGWYEMEDAPASWEPNGGISWFLTKVFCVEKWRPDEYEVEVVHAGDSIDANVYDKIDSYGQFFPPTMQTQYYCYPFDAYSEVTHDSIEGYGYVSARGGAKSGTPMSCDFFHPYRLDFDAFYMVDKEAKTKFPDNPHVMLGLEEMVDSIISQKGYMIRELHAVCNVPFENINKPDEGGWWGGITQSLYDDHLAYCSDRIDSHELTTYTASEVIRYRQTGHAVTAATLSEQADGTYTLSCNVNSIAEKYHDEISVIVKLHEGCDKLNVKYADSNSVWGDHPYRLPRKMNHEGTVWSINVNPFLGDAVIYPGQDWDGETVGVVQEHTAGAVQNISARVSGEMIQLNIAAGTYAAALFDPSGRCVRSQRVNAAAGGAGMPVGDLSRGMYILRLSGADQQLFQSKIFIR
ncbi:MAG: hypothetical protein ACQEQV_08225 [Fibrobacterota bacterium]